MIGYVTARIRQFWRFEHSFTYIPGNYPRNLWITPCQMRRIARVSTIFHESSEFLRQGWAICALSPDAGLQIGTMEQIAGTKCNAATGLQPTRHPDPDTRKAGPRKDIVKQSRLIRWVGNHDAFDMRASHGRSSCMSVRSRGRACLCRNRLCRRFMISCRALGKSAHDRYLYTTDPIESTASGGKRPAMTIGRHRTRRSRLASSRRLRTEKIGNVCPACMPAHVAPRPERFFHTGHHPGRSPRPEQRIRSKEPPGH